MGGGGAFNIYWLPVIRILIVKNSFSAYAKVDATQQGLKY